MIAPAVSEYKESERIRVELKSVIQNILADIDYFSRLKPELPTKIFFQPFAETLRNVFDRIADDKEITPLYESILKLNTFLLQAEQT
jgi:hypothetical protein